MKTTHLLVWALALHTVASQGTGRCCYSKWGDKSTCGWYPSGAHGGRCSTDPTKSCSQNSDCPATPVPPAPAPKPKPSPGPPKPKPSPSPPKPPAPAPAPPPPSNTSWPDKVVGLYLLVADDSNPWQYKSDTVWEPKLPDYMTAGGVNVLWMAFVNPSVMPKLPPGMQYIARHKPNGTIVIPSIGGEAYSASAQWPWLASTEAAEAMAVEVVGWKTKYGIDGVDLDIEGNQPGPTALAFARKCKQLDPSFIVTQPVFGSPAIKEEIYMVNECYKKGTTSAIDAVGIMVYEGTGSLRYVQNYVNGSHQWSGFPIHVDVPPSNVLLGAGGQSSVSTITTLAKAAYAQNLGGIMVWYASVIDPKTGKPGNQYSGGAMDSSIQSDAAKAAWKQANDIMHGRGSNTPGAGDGAAAAKLRLKYRKVFS